MSVSLVITPDGDLREVTLPAGEESSLPVMRREMGCRYVDVVRLTTRVDMWIDDEGAYTEPINLVATVLTQRHGRVYQPYFGTVLLCGVDDHGNSIDLTVDQTRALLTHLMDM
ncbi:DUF3846 domain-containing protein [Nonomuraea dietziae]|uniref:DUF3846 domain-containing protein n=1 Tax=Nonomuraea dietziae TaxID=65515 RepID=UPI003405E326